MVLIEGDRGQLPEGSGRINEDKSLTDGEKNQNANNARRGCFARMLSVMHICMNEIEQAGADAPGSYADVDSFLSAADQTEIADIGPKIRDILNGSKLIDPAQGGPWPDNKFNGV